MFPAFLPLFMLVAGSPADSRTAGFEALNRGDYGRAEELFSKAAAADPKDYTAIFNLASAQTSLNKDDAAAAHYQQVLTLKPGLYEAELNLRMLYLRDDRPANAVPLLREAVKSKPDEVRPKRYLGEALFASNDFAAPSDTFQEVLTIDPNSGAGELGLAQTLERQGKLTRHLRTILVPRLSICASSPICSKRPPH